MDQIDSAIEQAHRAFRQVPAAVIRATIQTESSSRPDAYLEEAGGDGSIGLMQIRLSVAKNLGYGGTKANLFLPAVNVYYGTKLLNDLATRLKVGETGDWAAVASAYNGGIRPELGFSARVKKPTTVCLRRDPKTGHCVKSFTAQPGQFGNQPHVDRWLKNLGSKPVGGTVALVVAAIIALGALFKAGGIKSW